MVIANDKRLSNTNYSSFLPPSWRTLQELTKLDDVSFKKSVKDSNIHSYMFQKEAIRLRKKFDYLRKLEALEKQGVTRGTKDAWIREMKIDPVTKKQVQGEWIKVTEDWLENI